MPRAIWNDTVLAESDDVVVVDGYTYFPRDSVKLDLLEETEHTSVCPWKGQAHYFDVVVDGSSKGDLAWYYPNPSTAASRLDGRIAFWRGVKIVADGAASGAAHQTLLDRLRRFLSRRTSAGEGAARRA